MTVTESIQAFLAELKIGHSERTVGTYSAALNNFQVFLNDTDTCRTASVRCDAPAAGDPVGALTAGAAIDFVHWLADTHFDGAPAKSTLGTYLAAMSQYYDYLIREELVTITAGAHKRMESAYTKFRRGSRERLPKPAADDVVEKLIRAAREVQAGDNARHKLIRLRNIAIVETLRATGMRVGELVSLERGDLTPRDHTARVIGKGDKERVVYFDRTAWRAVEIYLERRGDAERYGSRQFHRLPVFSRHDRAAGTKTLAISTQTVRDVFAALAGAAGIDEPVTPHSLRHAFATRALEKTEDLAVVQDLLGHSDPKTTRIYAKVRSRRLREAHQQIFDYIEEE